MHLKYTFSSLLILFLISSCGTSTVDSKKCISHFYERSNINFLTDYAYLDSKLIGAKTVTTILNSNTFAMDSSLTSIIYDNNNLVSSIHEDIYYPSGVTNTSNSIFEYNTNGLIKNEIVTEIQNGSQGVSKKYVYEWSNNNLTVNMSEEIDTDSSFLWRTYEFNSSGQITKATYYSVSFSPDVNEYVYDDKNSPFKNIIFPLTIWSQEPSYNRKINNIVGTSNSTSFRNYTYDNEDFPVSLTLSNVDGTINSTHTWTYD